MKMKLLLSMFFTLTILAACGQEPATSVNSEHVDVTDEAENAYVILGEDLQQLKDDFNANEGKVRLLFLSGPTCGICLRGMADLNDEFIAAAQNDDRLVTFVVHVPTLGAKEKHVADTIPLLNGPRVHHYWEESGIIGSHYTDVMDVNMYVWDFWTIYGPEARWDGVLPPEPDYYEHQLGVTLGKFRGFPQEKVLDAERFATEAGNYIERVDSTRFARLGDVESGESDLFADGTSIPVVAQPRNVAVSQYIRNRGGYKNIKRIETVEKHGKIEVGGRSYPLSISTLRPNQMRRLVTVGEQTSVAELSADGQVLLDTSVDRGLPSDLETKLLKTFEFDGRLIEWPDKGHQVSMQGMQKIGDVLAWQLDFTQSSGQHWQLYINSHGGDLVKASLLDDDGQLEYSIIQSDFRETSGFKFAHRVQYVDREGRLLAAEVFDSIRVAQQPFELDDEVVSH